MELTLLVKYCYQELISENDELDDGGDAESASISFRFLLGTPEVKETIQKKKFES